jgi:hypothetical protein
MRAEHFRDWFCATKHCGYSRVNQTWDEREIMEALCAVEDESGSEGGDHGNFPHGPERELYLSANGLLLR